MATSSLSTIMGAEKRMEKGFHFVAQPCKTRKKKKKVLAITIFF